MVLSPYAALSAAMAAGIIPLSLYTWRQRKVPVALPFSLMLFGVGVWLAAYSAELLLIDLNAMRLAARLAYFGIVLAVPALFATALLASGKTGWLTPRRVALLSIHPILTLGLVWTNPLHGLVWSQVTADPSGLFPALVVTHGNWFWVHTAYSYALVAVATWNIMMRYWNTPRAHRGEALVMMAGVSFPWLANMAYLLGFQPVRHLDLTPFAFGATALALAWGLLRNGTLYLAPIARSRLVEEVSDGVIVTDHLDRLVDMNPAAARMLCLGDRVVVGLPITQALGDHHRLVREMRRKDLAAPEVTLSSLGQERCFDLRSTALTSRRGRTEGWLWLLHDISDRKQAERELRRAKDAAETAVAVKSRFLAAMSHEIRTPMNGILGMVELVRSADSEEERVECLRIIGVSANALLSVINDILDFSKIEAKKLELTSAPFDLRAMVREVCALLEPSARQQQTQIGWTYDDAAPRCVRGDAVRVRQILFNVVGNAVKFTEGGHVSLEVACQDPGATPAPLRITVSDTGVGIPDHALSQIFEDFSQADVSTTRRFGGTGLGLAITRELVNRMDGRIEVESREGEGSTFRIWLSLPRAELRSSLDEAPAELPAAELAHSTKPIVLLVEDNAVNQKVATRMLEKLGCRVSHAADGIEAVAMFGAEEFDLIFMDIQMPRMDGLEATKRIRQLEGAGTHTPIVALTANAMAEDRESCLAAGMDDHLGKPVKMQVLEQALTRWLSKSPDAAATVGRPADESDLS